MEYIYAAMLLHKAGKGITEQNIKKVLDAAGIAADESRVKALVAALEGVDIDAAIRESAVAVPVAAAPAAASTSEAKAGQKAEEKKEEKKTAEDAAVGLSALFG